MHDFIAGKHVLITGASRGLGRALARAFHGRGAKVSLFSRSAAENDKVRDELGSRAVAFSGTIANDDQRAEALRTFRKAHGPVDVLINNAGIGAYEPFLTNTRPLIRETIETNFLALALLTHEIAEEMVPRRSGHIVNIASDLGRKPLANMAVYTATKHAVVGFSQSLARELRTHGIKSTVLTPGIIDTYFAGNTEGERAGPGALDPVGLAQLVVALVDTAPGLLIDELSVHALGQDF